jgi:hypothetical protein
MIELPTLSILPLDRLLIHERHDDQRALPLIRRLRSSGVFRNPPVVAPLNDGSERYMVLDGANRVTALSQMGYPHVLAQVVQSDDPGLTLYNWNHVVWELNALRFFRGVACIPRLRLVFEKDLHLNASLDKDCRLAFVQDCRGRLFSVCTQAETLEERVEILNAIVDSYNDKARLDRTNTRDIRLLQNIYPYLCGLVIFPTFRVADLLVLAGKGCLLPAGITRFTVAPRALHVNYPLKALAADEPLTEKNEGLRKWIHERIALKQIRYYSEPTFLFDE